MAADRAIAPPSKIQPNPDYPHKLRFETTIPSTLTDRQGFLSLIRSQQLTIAHPNPL
jgi:hypothetical protein